MTHFDKIQYLWEFSKSTKNLDFLNKTLHELHSNKILPLTSVSSYSTVQCTPIFSQNEKSGHTDQRGPAVPIMKRRWLKSTSLSANLWVRSWSHLVWIWRPISHYGHGMWSPNKLTKEILEEICHTLMMMDSMDLF